MTVPPRMPGHAELLHQQQRRCQIDGRLKQRLIPVVPEQALGFTEEQVDLPLTRNIKFRHEDGDCRRGEAVFRAEAEGDKSVEQCEQSRRPVSVNDEEEQVQFPVDAVHPRLILDGSQIAQTSGKSIREFIHQVVDAGQNELVVGVDAH